MPKGFTEYERDLIRERLLDEGYRQFSAYGLKKTTVEELAAAVGISKGAFYLFYPSKEALLMEVVEEKVEKRFRLEMLASVDQPGASSRSRLLALLKNAVALFRTVPLLKTFTGSDYDLLFRRLPRERMRKHLAADRVFSEALIARCRDAGIPIQVPAEALSGLLYILIVSIMHEGELGSNGFGPAVDVMLELIAAYCVGEVALE